MATGPWVRQATNLRGVVPAQRPVRYLRQYPVVFPTGNGGPLRSASISSPRDALSEQIEWQSTPIGSVTRSLKVVTQQTPGFPGYCPITVIEQAVLQLEKGPRKDETISP